MWGVVETELILADLETVSKRAGALEKEAKFGDKEIVKKLEIIKKVKSALEQGNLASACDLKKKKKF